MNVENSISHPEKIWLDALHAMNRRLAIIKDRLEIVLVAGTPEYIQSDLIIVYQAEREISEMVRSLVAGIMQRS